MNLKTIFVNLQERRLRAGWRLLIQTLLMLVIGLFVFVPVGVLVAFFPEMNLGMLGGQLVQVLIITVSVFLARRLLDRRSIVSLGLRLERRAALDLLAGIGITFAMMGLIYLIQWAAGWLQLETLAWQAESWGQVLVQTAVAGLVFVLVGWGEELLSRGYHLQTLASGLNLFWGVLLSSAVFGVLHLANPNATWISAAGITLAGLFLAYGYLRTRQLWLPIGLHIGWNFFEGVLFGFPVSGLETYRLLRIEVNGPELWTGGAFGPEAGLVLLPGLLLGTLLVYLYSRRHLQEEDNAQEAIDIH
ncbi:MAG: CPBP family intramembrane metalloprotease [Anaerolineales bacterium]|nr:CPBP family intramembrane metalloprotease [Anaerolineales bacterium]